MTYSLENINITNENGSNLETYRNIRCLNDNSSNHYFTSNKDDAYKNKDQNSDLIKIYSTNKAAYLINPLNKCNMIDYIDKNEHKNELFRIKQSSRKSGCNFDNSNKENRSNIYKSINNQNKVSSSAYSSELKTKTVGKPEKYIKNMKFIHNQSDAIVERDTNVGELNKRIKSSYLSPDNSTKHGSYDRYLSKLKGKTYAKNLINSEVNFEDGYSITKKTILFDMNCRICRNT